MSKQKSKRHAAERQTAINSATARQSPVAPPHARSASVKATPRDPITGEPLTFDSPKLLVRDYDARRDPLDRRAIPYQLHVSQNETEKRAHDPYAGANNRRNGGTIGTFAGGFRFSPAMREYLIPVLPASVAAYRSGWSVWWRNPYLVSRLRVRMGDVSVDALIAVRRDERDWNAVAARVEKSLPWLIRRDQLAFKLAREYYRSPQAGPIAQTQPSSA